MNVLNKKYYYFIGAGGIGMSALARYFKFLGKEVMGYDRMETELTGQLIEEGIRIHFEDSHESIPSELNPDNTLVIYTPAVPTDLGEYQYFKNNEFEIVKRSEVLGAITNETYGIAVAGTHGKTTTSSILAHILYSSDLEMNAFLGGVLLDYESNFLINGSKYTVAEADEYDRSFLRLTPKIAIITSMEPDHLDIYGTKESFEEAFIEFSKKPSEKLFIRKGLPIENADSYGVESDADYDAVNVKIENGYYHFDLNTPDGTIHDFVLSLLGRHNVENAVAAISVALYLGVSGEKIKNALQSFHGVKRRFNRWDIKGKVYIDDYAHHPTELDALIHSVREMFPGKKILGVFQPHLYTRTRDFMPGFIKSLSRLDELVLLDIYPARELPIEGITSKALAEKLDLEKKEVCSLADAMAHIVNKEFDVLITAGAGNVDTLVKPIRKWLDEA